MIHAFSKSRHSENSRKHPLVVSVENTSYACKGRDTENLEVLDKSSRTAGAHEGLSSLQRGIVACACVDCSAAHDEDVTNVCFSGYDIPGWNNMERYSVFIQMSYIGHELILNVPRTGEPIIARTPVTDANLEFILG